MHDQIASGAVRERRARTGGETLVGAIVSDYRVAQIEIVRDILVGINNDGPTGACALISAERGVVTMRGASSEKIAPPASAPLSAETPPPLPRAT